MKKFNIITSLIFTLIIAVSAMFAGMYYKEPILNKLGDFGDKIMPNYQVKYEDKQAELTQVQEDLSNAQSSLTASQAELTKTQTALTAKQAELTLKQTELTQVQNALTAKQEELAQAQITLASKQAEIEQIETQIDELNAQALLDGANLTELGAQIVELQNQKDALTNEKASIQTTAQELETSVASYQSQVATLIAEKATLETANTTLTNEKSALQTTVQELETSVASYQSQMQTLNTELTAMRSSYNNLLSIDTFSDLYTNNNLGEIIFTQLGLNRNCTLTGYTCNFINGIENFETTDEYEFALDYENGKLVVKNITKNLEKTFSNNSFCAGSVQHLNPTILTSLYSDTNWLINSFNISVSVSYNFLDINVVLYSENVQLGAFNVYTGSEEIFDAPLCEYLFGNSYIYEGLSADGGIKWHCFQIAKVVVPETYSVNVTKQIRGNPEYSLAIDGFTLMSNRGTKFENFTVYNYADASVLGVYENLDALKADETLTDKGLYVIVKNFKAYKGTDITLTYLGAGSFSSEYAMTEIVLPKTITEIRANAFLDCPNLTNVYFEGTQEQWNAITIGTGNDCLTSANITFNYVGA